MLYGRGAAGHEIQPRSHDLRHRFVFEKHPNPLGTLSFDYQR